MQNQSWKTKTQSTADGPEKHPFESHRLVNELWELLRAQVSSNPLVEDMMQSRNVGFLDCSYWPHADSERVALTLETRLKDILLSADKKRRTDAFGIQLRSVSTQSDDNPVSQLIDKQWLNTEQAARFLGISVGSLRNMTSNGQVRYYKLGRRNRYRAPDLHELLLSERRGS